ncbi:Uncharacterized protein EbC_23400 [Erwinia billingiae Eb661]|uniref:Uncharacterized protein n=1 Tax=Erwinia billingiae (strain Eb661) TaxID=634500 RepID=D8MSR4_ERWBE|nr:Uncharacterized protein EbC_23400 [Erwinia billingiae Eb661]
MRGNQAWAWVKFFIHISNLLSFMLRAGSMSGYPPPAASQARRG